MQYGTPSAIFLAVLLMISLASEAHSQESKNVMVNGMNVSEKTAELMKGGCEFNPYEKLQQLGVVSSGAEVAPKWVNGQPQAGIDPALACRLAKMFQSTGACAKITSAYRSAAKQQSMCGSGRTGCAAAGNSCHQYGLAVDISGSCLQRLRQIAPQFQLIQNPIPGDPYHFQCAEHPGAGRSSCKGPCNGGVVINPDPNALANATNYSPSSPLTDMFRQALGLNQQPPPPPPPPPAQQQPLQQAQQATQYFPSSQPTTNTGTPSTGSPSPITALSTSSQQYLGVTDTGTAYQPSVAEQLLQMAYGTAKQNPPQNTGTSVPLYLSPDDVGSVQVQNESSTTPYVAQNAPVGTLQPSQTFTSQDLSYARPAQPAYTPPSSGVFAVLETLKTLLLRLLEILRPMGIRNALQGDTHVEHVE